MNDKRKIITDFRFHKSSAESWCKLLTTKYSCEIITPPTLNEETKMWHFSYHDPMLDD